MRRLSWPVDPADAEANLTREWLVTNGLGGYASGTVAGVMTRRYHGCPRRRAARAARTDRDAQSCRRTVADAGRAPDRVRGARAGRRRLGTPAASVSPSFGSRAACRCGATRSMASCSRRRLFLTHMQNTVHVTYELVDGADEIELALRPSVNFRAQELPVSEPLGWPYQFRAIGDALRSRARSTARCRHCGFWCSVDEATFTLKGKRIERRAVIRSRRAAATRRAATSGVPATTASRSRRGTPASLVASTETFETMTVLVAAIRRSRRSTSGGGG